MTLLGFPLALISAGTMIPIWGVLEAMVSHPRSGEHCGDDREAATDRVLLQALRSGELDAFVAVSGETGYYCIPALYWDEPDANISVAGKLFAYPLDNRVPARLIHQPVYLEAGAVEEWRAAFRPTPVLRRGRKPAYSWPDFEAEAVDRLDYIGGFSEGWSQADLEREMIEWCDRSWEKTPAESTVREHVQVALATFLKSKAGN